MRAGYRRSDHIDEGVVMEPAVYVGVDIGKTSHYALAANEAGKTIYQTGVPNNEVVVSKLVEWARNHQATVVDQPGGAAALLLKLCWQSDVGMLFARAGDGTST
jgi:Transposase